MGERSSAMAGRSNAADFSSSSSSSSSRRVSRRGSVAHSLIVRFRLAGATSVQLSRRRDVRAVSRYYRADTVARFPMLTLGGVPAKAQAAGNIKADPIDVESETDRRVLREIDRWVLEYPREEAEIHWLLQDREGFLYRRNEEAIGFAFVGKGGVGPAAVLDAGDLPAILLHVEGRAFAADIDRIEFQVPAPNEVATRHLLSCGFRLDPWVNLLMSNRPFGRFDRLVSFGPPVFL